MNLRSIISVDIVRVRNSSSGMGGGGGSGPRAVHQGGISCVPHTAIHVIDPPTKDHNNIILFVLRY